MSVSRARLCMLRLALAVANREAQSLHCQADLNVSTSATVIYELDPILIMMASNRAAG